MDHQNRASDRAAHAIEWSERIFHRHPRSLPRGQPGNPVLGERKSIVIRKCLQEYPPVNNAVFINH